MLQKAVAKISWNRLSKEITYKSIQEEPKLNLILKQKGKKFVIHHMNVLSNGYTSRDLQHKLQNVVNLVNKKYGSYIK